MHMRHERDWFASYTPDKLGTSTTPFTPDEQFRLEARVALWASDEVRAAYDVFTDWLLDWWEGPVGGARDARALADMSGRTEAMEKLIREELRSLTEGSVDRLDGRSLSAALAKDLRNP
ncbi:hypothetical protein [Nocardioides nitrophenolicus]|uniref:hypothetical protein n=1 Tax=Nocardioides nitrophenolicus TaxID=60489 RepID=UPI0019583DB5|nr:hypothetical protein [Nocardioides nitrophenolicus]MBM7520060.1 hypothetical protein [Nocardioides nitrophenolicus]